MKNRPSIQELFDILEMEVHLLAEKTEGNENIGKIKAVSLMLEDKVNGVYKQIKWKNKKHEKPEIVESKTETCVCGEPWVYEDAGFCQVIGRCRDEYCFMNVKRQI